MTTYRIIKDQIVAGSGLDRHGESYPKSFFEDLLASIPPRLPLHVQHQMANETRGHLENFRIVPHRNEDEWVVIADVYITEGPEQVDLGGFSFSAIKSMAGNIESPSYSIYLPFPLYNDGDLVSDLLENNPDLMVGKWIKKGLSDLQIGLIFSSLCLLVGPEWDIRYKTHIRPRISKLLDYATKLRKRELTVDLVQQVEFAGRVTQLYFIPERASLDAEIESLKIENFESGYSNAIEFLRSDPKSLTVGATRIKLMYDLPTEQFKVIHVQYEDGTDVNIVD